MVTGPVSYLSITIVESGLTENISSDKVSEFMDIRVNGRKKGRGKRDRQALSLLYVFQNIISEAENTNNSYSSTSSGNWEKDPTRSVNS